MTAALSTLDLALLLMVRWYRCTLGCATQRIKAALEAQTCALQYLQIPPIHCKPTGRKHGRRIPLCRTPGGTIRLLGRPAPANGESQLLTPRLLVVWISRRGIVLGPHL